MMRHLDTVESVLNLLGDFVILREFQKKKDEICVLLKQSWAMPSDVQRSPQAKGLCSPQRRVATLPNTKDLPLRTPSLTRSVKDARPRSLNTPIHDAWTQLGGSYATTPCLPPLDIDDLKNSPCYRKGKGKSGITSISHDTKLAKGIQRSKSVGSSIISMDSDNSRRKENERATTLQTLIGKRPRVMDAGRLTIAGRKLKGVRSRDSQWMEESTLG